ncbi:CAP-associated domain-containing protein [Neobacillus sp. PS3-34]|nr:CAP-associated domain-containing protein [Neobacillus sp. PS3-34]WML49375.1 CAP-associated domain-containing protein [Neobacillus sp. PS3-34]
MSLTDNTEKDVLLKEDSSVYQKPPEALKKSGNQINSRQDMPNEGLSKLIGQNIDELIKTYGKPLRIDKSIYGYDWYIYNGDNAHYLQAGVENNKVVTIYAMGKDLNVAPFEIGESVEEIFNTQFFNANIDINISGNTYRFELTDMDLNTRPSPAWRYLCSALY